MPALIEFEAGSLVSIGDIREEILWNLIFFLELLTVFLCGAGNLNPAVGFPFTDLVNAIVNVPKSLHLVVLMNFTNNYDLSAMRTPALAC